MRFALVLLILLLMPVASAAIPINVVSQERETISYQNMPDQTYVFSLPNPPFNLSAPYTDFKNGSVYVAKMNSKFLESTGFSGTRSYSIIIEYNNNQTLASYYTYERKGWGVLGYWNAYYSVAKNGEEICHLTNRIPWKSNLNVNPEFTFSFAPSGSYNSLSSAVSFGTGQWDGTTANVSGEVVTNPPILQYHFDDNLIGKWGTNTLLEVVGASTPCAQSIGGGSGGFEPNTLDISGPPSITMRVSDQSLMTHVISYEFKNRTVELSDIASTIQGINADIQKCDTFSIVGLCIGEFLAWLLSFIFKIASAPITMILSVIPGADEIGRLVNTGLYGIVATLKLLLTLTLGSGSNYPIGGAGWMIVIWSLSLGFVVFAISGNPGHIIILPYLIIYAYVWLIVALTYGLFIWLPIKVYEIIAQATPG